MTGHRARSELPKSDPEPRYDVVVIGASAGGLHALAMVIGGLPSPFVVPIALVLHLSPDHESYLPQILSRATRHRVTWAETGSPLATGAVYAAPPNAHLELDRTSGTVLTLTPPEHFARPAIDRLFASAARAFGARTIAVLLTGNGYDGTAGALAVSRAGGVVIAQDEESSEYFSMPGEAIASGAVTDVVALEGIASHVMRLVQDGLTPSDSAHRRPAQPASPFRSRQRSPERDPRAPGS